MNPAPDPRLGRHELSFPEPAHVGASILVGTLAIVGTILLAVAVFASKPAPFTMGSDDWFGVALCAAFAAGGALLVFGGVRTHVRKPVWQFHQYGAVRTWNGGADAPLYWANAPDVVKVQRTTSSGQAVGYHLQLGKKRIDVPNMETADRGYALWQLARPPTTMREIR